MPKKPGFLLVSIIIITIVFSIIIYGTTAMIGQNLKLTTIQIDQTRALTSAQSGLMHAAFQVQALGNYNNTNDEPISGDQFYSFRYLTAVPGFEDLNINTSNQMFDNNGSRVTNWQIANSSTTESYTITRIRVDWDPAPPNISLKEIILGGTSCFSGNESSGTEVPLTPILNLPTGPTTISNNHLDFSSAVEGITITATFFLDNTEKFTVRLCPGQPNVINMIKSTGKIIRNGQTTMRKTILANFNIASDPKEYVDFDTRLASFSTGNKHIVGWDIQNFNPSQYYEITAMEVFWTKQTSARLREVILNNISVWEGNEKNGQKFIFNKTPAFLLANSTIGNNQLIFSKNMDKGAGTQTIRAVFFTTKNLSFEAQLLPASPTPPSQPTIVNGNQVEITKYKGTNNHIMP